MVKLYDTYLDKYTFLSKPTSISFSDTSALPSVDSDDNNTSPIVYRLGRYSNLKSPGNNKYRTKKALSHADLRDLAMPKMGSVEEDT